MNASWYDVLDVEPTASGDEVRTAWREAVADLDPTDRRFRVFNQAAEVLLDPAKRAAYDAELAAERAAGLEDREPSAEEVSETPVAAAESPAPQPAVGASARVPGRDGGRLPVVPGGALVVLAGLVAASLVVAGVLVSKPSDSSVEADTQTAQAAAERAIVPLLSYDA